MINNSKYNMKFRLKFVNEILKKNWPNESKEKNEIKFKVF